MVDVPQLVGLIQNIRANLCHMSRLIEPFNDRDSQLIDIINHMDGLLQQAEYELDDSDV